MPTHLFRNIQNAQLHKQEDENGSGSLGGRDGFTQPIFYKRFDRISL